MEMFVKRDENNTLEATFKEAIKVEKDMLSLKGNPGVETSKDKTGIKTKTTMTKPPDDKKGSRIQRHGSTAENCKKSPMKSLT
jgi:hypothetical protein